MVVNIIQEVGLPILFLFEVGAPAPIAPGGSIIHICWPAIDDGLPLRIRLEPDICSREALFSHYLQGVHGLRLSSEHVSALMIDRLKRNLTTTLVDTLWRREKLSAFEGDFISLMTLRTIP